MPPAYQAPAWPELPARPTDAAQVAAGELLYNRYCSRCHVFGHSILPDLRRLSPATHSLFGSIVLEGAYAPKGMGRFDDVLTPADADAIHTYITEQAWVAKTAGLAH
jgi:quinohemoprotein ethanol dehydrogenase